uniref:Lipoprotein n=1 Tax=Lepeophtheirus salmonis TaxID=72036 RepID=A0A0K2V6L3_LEPSM
MKNNLLLNNPWILPFIIISCFTPRDTTYFRHCITPAELKRIRDSILFLRSRY